VQAELRTAAQQLEEARGKLAQGAQQEEELVANKEALQVGCWALRSKTALWGKQQPSCCPAVTQGVPLCNQYPALIQSKCMSSAMPLKTFVVELCCHRNVVLCFHTRVARGGTVLGFIAAVHCFDVSVDWPCAGASGGAQQQV
jgi:hypothetical protein